MNTFFPLWQGSAKPNLRVKFSLQPIFASKVLLEQSYAHLFKSCLWVLFATAVLSSWDRDHMPRKALKCLLSSLYRKSFLSPKLKDFLKGRYYWNERMEISEYIKLRNYWFHKHQWYWKSNDKLRTIFEIGITDKWVVFMIDWKLTIVRKRSTSK